MINPREFTDPTNVSWQVRIIDGDQSPHRAVVQAGVDRWETTVSDGAWAGHESYLWCDIARTRPVDGRSSPADRPVHDDGEASATDHGSTAAARLADLAGATHDPAKALGWLRQLDWLLQSHVNEVYRDRTALYHAVAVGGAERARLLLRWGADMHATQPGAAPESMTPFRAAITAGRDDVIHALIDGAPLRAVPACVELLETRVAGQPTLAPHLARALDRLQAAPITTVRAAATLAHAAAADEEARRLDLLRCAPAATPVAGPPVQPKPPTQ